MAAAEDVVVVGSSAGGLAALRALLGGLAAEFPWAVVLVQHGIDDRGGWIALLASHCALPVAEAEPGAQVAGGRVWLAPSGYHLLIEPDRRFALSVDDKVCFVRPSADVLFASAADAYRERVTGVVLTGANDDGARGLAAIRARGGAALVQDPAEAEVPEMPGAALRIAGADRVLKLKEIAAWLNRAAGVAA